MIIETKNLKLIRCTPDILRAAIAGDDVISEKLAIAVQPNWTMFGIEALQYALNKIQENPEEKDWWTYLPIFKRENKLIGSGGYKGKPTAQGSVELGYEIAEQYRNRGLATEMTQGLIENAFRDNRVQLILAHTLGEENASTKVLLNCGFVKTNEINDPDDGLIWRWELVRV